MGGVTAPQNGLRRTIGLRTVISTSAGLTFASSTFLVVVTVGMLMGGNGAWLPICIAGILCAIAAAAFAELCGLYPNAAGIRVYVQRAFGEEAAQVVALTYMSVVTLVVGAEAYVLSYVLHTAIPQIPPPIWIVLMITLATVANFRGLKVAGMLQDIITYSVVVSIVLMSLFALNTGAFHPAALMHPGSPGSLFTAVGIAIFLFVGFEWVTPLAEEVKDHRSIARGMFAAVILLTVVYSLVATAMFATTGRAALFGTVMHRVPTPHLVFALTALGRAGAWVMIVTSLFMSLTTFNAGLISVSRFIYASARDHVLPPRFAHVSLKYATPDVAVFTIYVVALVVSMAVYFTRSFVTLINLAAVTEALIYSFALVTVASLRKKDASRERPYRMVGGSVLAISGSVLFLLVGLGVVFQNNPAAWGAGILLVVIAAGWFAYVRKVVLPRKEQLKLQQKQRRASRRPQSSEEL